MMDPSPPRVTSISEPQDAHTYRLPVSFANLTSGEMLRKLRAQIFPQELAEGITRKRLGEEYVLWLLITRQPLATVFHELLGGGGRPAQPASATIVCAKMNLIVWDASFVLTHVRIQ